MADELGSDLRASVDEPLSDMVLASDVLIQLIERRIRLVHSVGGDAPLGLMLSGGVDSILVAACAVRVGFGPSAVTVVTAGPGGARIASDDERASVVAAHLGIGHKLVRMLPEEVLATAKESVRRLGVSEMWEVTSAIPLLSAMRMLDQMGAAGPALAGSGADALFLGGYRLAASPTSPEAVHELRNRILTGVRRQFIRDRLVPDYDERLLGQAANRFVRIFQTRSFWEFAQSIHPSLLWRQGPDGKLYDKFLLRFTAERLGIPAPLVFTEKSPIQMSSGTVAALLHCAREDLAQHPANRSYADPMIEPTEHTAVRLFLDRLAQAGE
ncbi:MAG: asparagine synthase C-terminal domain-containing protein [Mycobacterium sp.]